MYFLMGNVRNTITSQGFYTCNGAYAMQCQESPQYIIDW